MRASPSLHRPVESILLGFLLFLFLPPVVHAQVNADGGEARLPVGQVLDALPVAGSNGETFAAYLPEAYAPDRLNPILFIFDPAARGSLAVRNFVPVADAHGLILVCSNDSRNGPYDRNFESANRLFNEVFGRFPIDENRIYTTGFSGGSRLAASIAVLSGQIRGVLGCGAGFEQASGYLPRPGAGFHYAGIVGNQDMNYIEMQQTRDFLEKFSIPNKLITFEGGHAWPPTDCLLRGMDWLLLTTRGDEKPDSTAIRAGLDRSLAAASAYAKAGKLRDAVREYRDLQTAYGEYFGLDSIADRIHALKSSRAFRFEEREFKKVREEEQKELAALINVLEPENLGKPDGLEQWVRAWEVFRKKHDPPQSQPESDMVQRIEGSIRALGIERADNFRRAGNYAGSRNLSRMLTISFPKWSYAYIRLAADCARLGEEQLMWANLQKALELGFRNRAMLESEPAFEPYIKRDAWLSLFGTGE